MIDTDVDDEVVSQADEATQKRAEAAGWIPPARAKALKGKPFVDADEFLARQDTMRPLIKRENEALRQQVETLTSQQAQLAETLATAQKAIDAMELEASAKTAKAVEKAKSEVKAELAKALADGDHEAAAALTQQQADLAAIDTTVTEKKVEKPAAPPVQAPDPVFLKWASEIPWWNAEDPASKRLMRAAMVVSQELRANNTPLRGREFLDEVARIVEEDFGPREHKQAESKVDSGRNSDGGRQARRSGYDGLSAEAKAACDDAGRGKFGPGKAYADQAAFRAVWLKAYNED